jgi:ribosomal protein L24E
MSSSPRSTTPAPKVALSRICGICGTAYAPGTGRTVITHYDYRVSVCSDACAKRAREG